MLKILILFVLLSTVSAEKLPREKLHKAQEKCERELPVTLKEIHDLRNDIAGDTDYIDRKYKCFVKCVLDELDIKDESGKIDFKQLGQVYFPTDTHTQEVFAECGAKHDSETDDCERQFKTVVCVALSFKEEQDHHEEIN